MKESNRVFTLDDFEIEGEKQFSLDDFETTGSEDAVPKTEASALDYFFQGTRNRPNRVNLFKDVFPELEATTATQRGLVVAGEIAADPLSYAGGAITTAGKAIPRAVAGVADMASGILPTWLGGEVSREVTESTGSELAGVFAGLGSAIVAGNLQGLGSSAAIGAAKGAKRVFSEDSTTQNLVKEMVEDPANLVGNLGKLKVLAEQEGVELPPYLAAVDTRAGNETLSNLYSKDLEFRKAVDETVIGITNRIRNIAETEANIDTRALEYNAKLLDDQAEVKDITDFMMNVETSPIILEQKKIEKTINDLSSKFASSPSTVSQAIRGLESKRLQVVKTEKDKLYGDAFKLAKQSGNDGMPTPEATFALRIELKRLFDDDAFREDNSLRLAALRALGKKVKDLKKKRKDLKKELKDLKDDEGLIPIDVESNVSLKELQTLRRRIDKQYRKDPEAFGRMRNLVDETIDSIPDTRVLDAFRKADDYFAKNVGLPANYDAFLKLTKNKREATSEALVSDRQALEEFLLVHKNSPEALKVVDVSVKGAIEKKARSYGETSISSKSLTKALDDPKIKDVIDLLPRQTKLDIEEWANNTSAYNKQWAEQQVQLEQVQKEIGDNVLVKLSGTGGVSSVARNYATSPAYRAEIEKSLSTMHKIDDQAAGNARQALRAHMLDLALEQKDPIAYIQNTDRVEGYRKMFDGDLNTINRIVELQGLVNKIVPKLTSTRLANDTGDYQPRFGGQTVPSLISTMTNPIYSKGHSAAVITSRALASLLKKEDKDSVRLLMLNPELMDTALKAGKKGNVKKFMEEMGKFMRYNMAMATARASYQAEKQNPYSDSEQARRMQSTM
jgi:hypothetical protein